MKSSVMHFLKDFSILLRIKREKLNFSQFELASKLGISLRTYQRIECGDSEPSLSQVYKLAHILNFDVSEIFHYEKGMSDELKLLHQSSNEIEQLAKLSRIGSWNLDPLTGECSLSKIIKEILDTAVDFNPSLSDLWQFIKPGHSLELTQSSLDECINNFKAFNIEVDLLTSKGENRHCVITGMPEVIDKKVIRVYGVLQDNTKCIKIQMELLNSLEKFNDLHHFAEFGCWNLNLQNNKLLWSPSLYDLYEFEIEKTGDISYEVFLDAVHPEDREMVDINYKESLVTNKSYETEHRIILANGEIKWILTKYKTDFDSDGIAFHSYGYALDITKYKNTPKLSL